MDILDIFLRGITVFLYIVRETYWGVTERVADTAKPKRKSITIKNLMVRIAYRSLVIFLVIQLLGVQLFPFPHSFVIQSVGLLLVIIGVVISFIGRKELGVNWAHAAEYQIKKNQQLVTTGIYQYIRHPLYAGIVFAYIGAELVAQSYLAYILIPFLFGGAYIQAKREEKILVQHFGNVYKDYIKRTRMLIPYLL